MGVVFWIQCRVICLVAIKLIRKVLISLTVRLVPEIDIRPRSIMASYLVIAQQ